MWENAYLSFKNPKASGTLDFALDPGCWWLTLFKQVHQVSNFRPHMVDQILDLRLMGDKRVMSKLS